MCIIVDSQYNTTMHQMFNPRKGNKMTIQRICSYTYRYIGSPAETDIYYFYKKPSGKTWYIKKAGELIKTCKSKAEALAILAGMVK